MATQPQHSAQQQLETAHLASHQSLIAHSFLMKKAKDEINTNLQPMCYQISSSWAQMNPEENKHESQKAS